MNKLVNLGARLRVLRKERKYTQKQVADRIGHAVSAISAYESGSRYPSYDVLVKLARIYSVSTDYLLGITNSRPLDTSGLTDEEIASLTTLIQVLQAKHHNVEK